MEESSRLYVPLLSPEELVRKYRYNPFMRGRYIRALKESVCTVELPAEISPDLLSVINDCLFPRDIEAILTQHASQPCLLAHLRIGNVDLSQYPAIQKVAAKFKSNSLFLHTFLQQASQDLSDEGFRTTLNNFRLWDIDFNARDAKGNTALHIAARRGLKCAKILAEEFGVAIELSNNALEIPHVVCNIIPSSLHVAIEQRDVDAFRAHLSENNLTREHPLLSSPLYHLESLMSQYKNNPHFKTPRQWWRNRKLERMREMYQAKTLSTNSLPLQGYSSDEQELGALNSISGNVFTRAEKPDNFSEEWVINVFKKDLGVVDKLLTRCVQKKDGWKVLFNAAMNLRLELKEEQRETLLKKVLIEVDFLAERAESTSDLIKDFSALYQVAREIKANEVLLEKVFEAVKPTNLIEKMGQCVKLLMNSPNSYQNSLRHV